MKSKRFIALLLSVVLGALVFLLPVSASSVYTYETQFDYNAPDKAWLTDLVIKEDLKLDPQNVPGMVSGCKLIADPDYPYTETADSFKKEVEQFCTLYALNENMIKASYLYFFEFLGSNSFVFAAQATDADVKSYLTHEGIVYPANPSSDLKVLAKALYTAMLTGAFTMLPQTDLGAGVQLETAITSFMTDLSGMKTADLVKWIPGGEISSLDDYLLAVSRLTLWSNGYDVTPLTPESEVYKLMAVMTIRSLGYSVDADADFATLQSKYTAALIGKRYNVTVDPETLAAANANGEAAFYILQLIGQKEGLTVRMTDGSYEDTFLFVAAHTDLFDLEEGEFYADIYKYDLYLTAPRASLWICPTSYYGTVSPSEVSITCNGASVKDGYYTQVPISSTADLQTLRIRVDCVAGEGSVKEYVITVHNGKLPAEGEEQPAGATEKTFLSSASIITQILSAVGVSPDVAEYTNTLITTLPDAVKHELSLIAPTFGDIENVEIVPGVTLPSEGAVKEGAEKFISALDQIGALVNSSITGVDGIDLSDKYPTEFFDFNFITFAN